MDDEAFREVYEWGIFRASLGVSGLGIISWWSVMRVTWYVSTLLRKFSSRSSYLDDFFSEQKKPFVTTGLLIASKRLLTNGLSSWAIPFGSTGNPVARVRKKESFWAAKKLRGIRFRIQGPYSCCSTVIFTDHGIFFFNLTSQLQWVVRNRFEVSYAL